MLDPTTAGLRALEAQSPAAIALVFAAGCLSSIGPCTAPRMIALSALTLDVTARAAQRRTVSFIVGLACAYACFGVFAALVARLALISSYIYLVVAIALAAGGIRTLYSAHPSSCRHAKNASSNALGSSFFLGASFAFVLSPCCTPLVMGILTFVSATGDVLYAAALLAVFAIGHAAPLIAASTGVRALQPLFSRFAFQSGMSLISAALMLALAGYYLCLT